MAQLQPQTPDRQYWLQQSVVSLAVVQVATPVWPQVPAELLLAPPLDEPPELVPRVVEPPVDEPPLDEPPLDEPPPLEEPLLEPPVEPLDAPWARQWPLAAQEVPGPH